MDADATKTLEELDGQRWPEPKDSTDLIDDVHRLRRVPIGNLSDGDLNLLLGQRVGAEWLVPRALERLETEPLAGDLYPGDLLGAVLRTSGDYWNSHPTELMRLWRVREALESIREVASKTLEDDRWPAFG